MSNLEKPTTGIYAFRELREKGFTCGSSASRCSSERHKVTDSVFEALWGETL